MVSALLPRRPHTPCNLYTALGPQPRLPRLHAAVSLLLRIAQRGPSPHPRVTATAVLRPESLRPARLGHAPLGLGFGRLRCPPASAHSFCVYKQGDGLSATSGSVSTAPPSGQVGPDTARGGARWSTVMGGAGGIDRRQALPEKDSGSVDDHKSSFMRALIISDSCHYITVSLFSISVLVVPFRL